MSRASEGSMCRPLKSIKSVLLITLALCLFQISSTAHATTTAEQLLEDAIQRLHWNGLYLPDIEITVSDDRVATVTGTVATDLVKEEVVQILSLTDGIRGVINQLTVTP